MGSAERMIDLFHDLVLAAYADGMLQDEEEELLDHCRRALGVSPGAAQEILARVEGGSAEPRFEGSPSERLQALRFLQDVIQADGVIDPAEDRLLQATRKRWGLESIPLEEDEERLEDELQT